MPQNFLALAGLFGFTNGGHSSTSGLVSVCWLPLLADFFTLFRVPFFCFGRSLELFWVRVRRRSSGLPKRALFASNRSPRFKRCSLARLANSTFAVVGNLWCKIIIYDIHGILDIFTFCVALLAKLQCPLVSTLSSQSGRGLLCGLPLCVALICLPRQ